MIVDDPVDADETLNTDLTKIHDWSMKWLVKFNPSHNVDSGKGFLGNQVYVLTPISIIRYGKA
jgi:hypothetical protein